ncbi:MAG: hypothetical protein R2734_01230 [Nocardioides sp.]
MIAPNPVGRVLMRLTREGPRAALEEQARRHGGGDVRRGAPAHVGRGGRRSWSRRASRGGGYGGRTANDLLTDDDAKRDPAYFERLLALELAWCDQEPYRRFGGFCSRVVAERP